MRVIAKKKLLEYSRKYAGTLESLLLWERDIKNSKATNIQELRQDRSDVDYLKDWGTYCFNIKGNQYRLIAGIHWGYAVYLKEFLTHADYTKKYVKGVNQ